MELLVGILAIAGAVAAWLDIRSGTLDTASYLVLPFVGVGLTYLFR